MSPAFPTDNPAVKAIELRKEAARDGTICTVSGWGYIDEKQKIKTDKLQVAEVRLISYEEGCSKYANNTDGNIHPGMICAAYIGRDASIVSTVSFFT